MFLEATSSEVLPQETQRLLDRAGHEACPRLDRDGCLPHTQSKRRAAASPLGKNPACAAPAAGLLQWIVMDSSSDGWSDGRSGGRHPTSRQ